MISIVPILACASLFAEAPATAPASEPDASSRFLVVSDAELDALITRLGHPRFVVRQEALERLCRLDARHLPDLARRYRELSNYELQMSLRQAVESIFFREQIAGRDGFLGVSISRQVDQGVIDPVTGQRTRGVVVVRVLPDLPAAEAGLRQGDLIIGVDGKPLPQDPTSKSFIKRISGRPPGTGIVLRVLRPASQDRRVDLVVASDEQGKPLTGMRFEAPVPGVAQGPRVVEVTEDTPAAEGGLQVNDAIESLNGQSLVRLSGFRTLKSLAEMLQPGDRLEMNVRGLEEARIEATLGARPLEYIEPTDRTEARARFMRWWRDQGGELRPTPEVTSEDGTARPVRTQPTESQQKVIP